MAGAGDRETIPPEHRDSHRYRVLLPVRNRGRSCVVENLSRGGVYVRNAHDAEPGDELELEVELPGSYCFKVTVRVSYVLDDAAAAACGRRPGAGAAILDADPGFEDALSYYLHRLQRRRDFVVMASDPECQRLLAEAGYRVEPAPPPGELIEAVSDSDAPVVGVIVSSSQRAAYLAAAQEAGDPSLVHAVDYIEELDESLTRFDRAV